MALLYYLVLLFVRIPHFVSTNDTELNNSRYLLGIESNLLRSTVLNLINFVFVRHTNNSVTEIFCKFDYGCKYR